MGFAGIAEEDQYNSSLPEDVKVRTRIEKWEHVDKLVMAHQRIRIDREEKMKKRERVDFVSGGKEEVERAPARKKSRFDR